MEIEGEPRSPDGHEGASETGVGTGATVGRMDRDTFRLRYGLIANPALKLGEPNKVQDLRKFSLLLEQQIAASIQRGQDWQWWIEHFFRDLGEILFSEDKTKP